MPLVTSFSFSLAIVSLALATLASLGPPGLAATSVEAQAVPVAPAPVILEGRIVQVDSLESSGLRLLVEVDDVLHGFAPGSTLVVEAPSPKKIAAPLRRLLQTGENLRWVLIPQDDGSFSLQDGYRLAPPSEPTEPTEPSEPSLHRAPLRLSLPGGIWVTPESPPDPESEDAEAPSLSRIAGASSATPTFEERVVEIVNQERLANGNLPPLKHHPQLDASSELHSSNMAIRNFFAHCDLDTHTEPWDRMQDEGYFWSFAGENIAAGQSSPESVMTGWMASAGHRANILHTGFLEIGVGYVLQSTDTSGVRRDLNLNCVQDSSGGPYFRYWTQNFGSRFGISPVVIEREAHVTTSRLVDLYVYGTGWAQDMRFSNDGSTWSSWQAFNPNKSWELSSGSGVKTVFAQLRNGASVRSSSDTIFLNSPCTIGTSTLDLSNQTVNGNQTFEACDQITAHTSFHVSGSVIFRAGQRIVLGDGFSVGNGASFEARIQTP